ncbi:hypothetical protein [Paraburkholderia phenoliruptrix]|uniref:hypothetical protein n=1 Tax=Paraburkholderia phenoliruptrix TaxID=252970 RepID=UPI001C4FDC7D|nr:hypothetical protein [Paraburkholderia phenoliruptrix]MBW0449021.1 hypothetical protein [Paraburkholderia phenoliruptrix]MBW9097430.1 hypothetical protein [Paraburkholderia phenoliruptrix]
MKKRRSLFAELKEGMDALRAERAVQSQSLGKDNPHIGSSFDDFLVEDGRLEEATATALDRIRRLKR